MRSTVAVLALSLTLATTLAGCGGSGEEIRSGGRDLAASSAPSSPATPSTGAAAGSAAPGAEVEACALATEADVESAFGQDLPAGSPVSGGVNQDGVEWRSDICRWEVEDGLEVKVAHSTAEDFADGALLCPELRSFGTAATPVRGLKASSASWVVDEIDADEGTLRLCTDTALIDIDVEHDDGAVDGRTMRKQAVALAEVVLANLG